MNPANPVNPVNLFQLLHLCDSLFPIGGLSHSDGLEAATANGLVTNAIDLRHWMNACFDETLGRSEAPAAWRAWHAFAGRDWDALSAIDQEVHALRPSSGSRTASRGMGTRLLKTWLRLHAHPDLAWLLGRERGSTFTLPVAFGAVCASSGIDARLSLEGFVYTRLAATASSAMRLMAIGQHEAHLLLSEMLARASTLVDTVVASNVAGDDALRPFAPALDQAVMSQTYVHSRLFRS